LTYNAVNNRIISPGFEYDAAGNQTMAVIDNSGTRQQYRYDCANRLVQVSDASGNVLATHAYGAGNERLMSVEGSVTTYFAWDAGEIICEYEAWGTNALIWKTSYVYLGGQLLATTSGADGTETRFHHPGRLGTRLVTALDGTVVTEQFTMPFGNMQPFTSVYGGENPYQNPTLRNPSKKRFTSYDRSDVTRLDYAKNRFYSSQQGRFTQVDPIGMNAASLADPQTLNMYSYCGNDPINHCDPDGLFFGKLFGWIGKAFKWIARVAAVILAVAAVLAIAWSGNPFITISAWKLLLGAAKFALDGWGSGKWSQLISAGLGAYLGFNVSKFIKTPPFAGAGVGGASAFLQANQQKELTKKDVKDIIVKVSKVSGDPFTSLINIFNDLGDNVKVKGSTVSEALKESSVDVGSAGNALLSNAEEVTKSGNSVTIQNKAAATQNIEGTTLMVDKTVSFKVGSEKGIPTISGIEGLRADVGVTVSVTKIQAVTEKGLPALKVTGKLGFISKSKIIPLQKK
jgi:RHS repeat-associated protein